MTEKVNLPKGKDSFKLNEVCKLAGVQPYMLRYWSTEFAELEAEKSGTGQRIYTREQVETILEVRRLLFDEGLTIAGVRKRIESGQVKKATGQKKKATKSQPAEDAEVHQETSDGAEAEEGSASDEVAEATEEAAEVPDVEVVAAEEVDKLARERVQPLVATLRKVREELDDIVTDLST